MITKRQREHIVVAMEQQTLSAVGPSYRNAGLAAIISGVVGILAFGLLMDAVLTRASWIPSDRIYLLFRSHDIGVALQFLLLIPVIFGLRMLSRQFPPLLQKVTCNTGVVALIFVVILLLLGVAKIVSDGFYMFPQGVFGVFLIIVNWRLYQSLPGWLRWPGMIVGFGLALVGLSFIGLCFVYSTNLVIPAVPQENVKEVDSAANTFFHQLLSIASFVGVAFLPVWTILTGMQLLKRRRLTAEPN